MTSEKKPGKTARYGMTIDVDRCNGCGACMVACAVENNVPPAAAPATAAAPTAPRGAPQSDGACAVRPVHGGGRQELDRDGKWPEPG